MSATPETVTEEPAEEKRWLGIYDGLEDHEYRTAVGVNKSSLDLIAVSPLHYKTIRYNPKPPTPNLIFGNALHCLVLEPDQFDNRYVLEPSGINKRTKAGKAEYQQFMDDSFGKIILTNKTDPDKGIWGAGDWDRLHYMADSVLSHPIASILLKGIAERSIWWVDKSTGKLCKGRIDIYNQAHNLLVDLKSTADASYSGFAHSVHKYRYFVQDAFYSDGANALDMNVKGFVFVCVEKEPPYAVACYIIEPEWRRVGREIYQRNLETFKRCQELDEWPSFPDEVRDMTMPGYAKFHPIS